LGLSTKQWFAAKNGAFEDECTLQIRAFATTAKMLWIGFGDRSVHAKPCFNCVVPVQARQATLRSLGLTRLDRRALRHNAPPVWGGQWQKRSVH
jgi:hypothetical protein